MVARPTFDEVLEPQPPASQEDLLRRILPQSNPDRQERARAWADWQKTTGESILARYIGAHNGTRETDEDIIQEALLTAYLSVERGRYQPRAGVPFTAYVIGIARNKIREARRRERRLTNLDEDAEGESAWENYLPPGEELQRQPERVIERREQHEQLRGGIARLPGARRQVLEQTLAGASTGEIAGQLAISEDLVRQHKCRGLRALQKSLAPVQSMATAD